MRGKLQRNAQQAIAEVFENLGGVEALTAWAKLNPDKFYLFLWPRLLPKEVKAEIEMTDSRVSLNVVEVQDVSAALNALEQLRYADDTHSGRGGDSDRGPMERALPAHALRLSEPDGGGAGDQEEDGPADASEAREDDFLRAHPTVPLPDTVPMAGGDVRHAQR